MCGSRFRDDLSNSADYEVRPLAMYLMAASRGNSADAVRGKSGQFFLELIPGRFRTLALLKTGLIDASLLCMGVVGEYYQRLVSQRSGSAHLP